jgi:hypothetical protein
MTAKVRKTLEVLKANIRRNSPIVRKKLAKSGATPNPAVVFSAAKYFKTLKKLAKE